METPRKRTFAGPPGSSSSPSCAASRGDVEEGRGQGLLAEWDLRAHDGVVALTAASATHRRLVRVGREARTAHGAWPHRRRHGTSLKSVSAPPKFDAGPSFHCPWWLPPLLDTLDYGDDPNVGVVAQVWERRSIHAILQLVPSTKARRPTTTVQRSAVVRRRRVGADQKRSACQRAIATESPTVGDEGPGLSAGQT
jgi:hypothetical protein